MKATSQLTRSAKILKESNRYGINAALRYILLLVLFLNALPGYGQSVITVFSENWDNASSTQPWKYFSSGWFHDDPLNTLQNETGKGKVLKVNFPNGTIGTTAGFGNYRIPLDSAYKELYLSWEYFIPSTFDYGYADGQGGGKFFASFAGGSMTAIPNSDNTEVDGWVSILLFQNGTYSTYNYFKGSSFDPYGWPNGDRIAALHKGEWRRVTIRMKVNDGDLSNGLFEVFDNDVLVYQQTNAKIVNSAHPEYLIEHIYLNTFFGGGSAQHICPVEQYMEFDNLTAFYYPQGSPNYRAGASENGRVIQVPQATSYHPVPPNKFTPATYTDANGTIQSHCGFAQAVNHNDGFETSTIQVSGATSLKINVTRFDYDNGVGYSGYKQVLKIYQGIGSGRVLKQTYEKGGMAAPGSLEISGNSATIEWQAGIGSHDGFEIKYTSNGSGSGKNCLCSNYFAVQGKGSSAFVPVPAAPSSLSYTAQTKNSISLKWSDNDANEQGFKLYRSLSATDGFTQVASLSANVTSYTDNSLQPSTTYHYKIVAYNQTGNSAFSSVLTASTSALQIPAAPGNLSVTNVDYSAAILSWADNSSNENGFDLERSGPNDLTVKNTISLQANTSVYNESGLISDAIYQYRVRAKNADGNSSWSNIIEVKTLAQVVVVDSPEDTTPVVTTPVVINNSPTITNQQFTIREDNFSGNYIGKVISTDPDPGQNLEYAIVSGNNSGLFTIDSRNGNLSITSTKIFGPGSSSYEIIVQVKDDAAESKTATAKIKVILVGQSSTVYINPENTNDALANGSIYHPFDTWNDITWKEGYTYLQKRGTVVNADKIMIGANNVSIGAYGDGELPVIASETNTYLLCGFEKSGIRIQNLNLQADNAVSCIYFLGSTNDSIVIDHCILTANVNAIKIVEGKSFVSRYNTITSMHEGIFTTAIFNDIYYNIFKKCSTAVNVMSDNSKAEICNNVFFDNKESVSVTYAELTLYNNIFYMDEPGQTALKLGAGKIQSDHNIFYPEQSGFVKIANAVYNSLQQLQLGMKIDLNSFNSDPQFVDMYNENFAVTEGSPAINAGINVLFGLDFTGNKVPQAGVTDIGVLEFGGNNTNRNNEPGKNSSLTLYPNPSTGNVNIMAELLQEDTQEGQAPDKHELKVMDMSGKIVFSKIIANNVNSTFQEEIDLSGYSNGLYFIVLQMADKVLQEKLILSK